MAWENLSADVADLFAEAQQAAQDKNPIARLPWKSWTVVSPAARAQYVRQWKDANRAKVREQRRRYRAAHRAEHNGERRRWRAANPDKVREQRRRYRVARTARRARHE